MLKQYADISPARRRLFAVAQVRGKKHPNGSPVRVKPECDPVWVRLDPMQGIVPEMLMPDDFEIYAMDECVASICTSLSVEEATQRLNANCPSETMSTWKLSTAPTFFGSKHANGCDCPEIKGHRHFLFVC